MKNIVLAITLAACLSSCTLTVGPNGEKGVSIDAVQAYELGKQIKADRQAARDAKAARNVQP